MAAGCCGSSGVGALLDPRRADLIAALGFSESSSEDEEFP